MSKLLPSSRRRTISALAIAGLLGATSLATITGFDHTTPATAQTAFTRAPAEGFGDLVEKVMPAVVSVEAKLGVQTSSNIQGQGDENDDDNESGPQFSMPDLPPNSPFRQFFEQFPRRGFGGQPFQFPRPRGGTAQGSGFFISDDGYVVTNNHVVRGASEVTVKVSSDREYKAKIVGTDPKTDLALLKVDSNERFSYVNFSAKEPRVGDWVIAVGNPFGLGGSVTTGIVSARGRNIGNGPYDDFLQIDAPINRGNSGGPAFNLDGEVIGINTAIFSPSGGSIGIGFAIPSAEAVHVIEDLKDKGSVTRGWLGVQIQPITDEIADSVGLKESQGALVADVTPNSPALKAGIKIGDAIVRLDGEAVKDPSDLARRVARISPGKPAKVTVMREGKEEQVELTIGTMPIEQKEANAKPDANEATPAKPKLGLTLEKSSDGKGVVVSAVEPDSPASSKGFRAGDVVLKVGNADVNDPSALVAAIEQASKDGQKSVLLLVRSGERQRFVALPTAAKG
jgi:serine protease Do